MVSSQLLWWRLTSPAGPEETDKKLVHADQLLSPHTHDEMAQNFGHLIPLYAIVTQTHKRLVKSKNVSIVVYDVGSFPKYQEITV